MARLTAGGGGRLLRAAMAATLRLSWLLVALGAAFGCERVLGLDRSGGPTGPTVALDAACGVPGSSTNEPSGPAGDGKAATTMTPDVADAEEDAEAPDGPDADSASDDGVANAVDAVVTPSIRGGLPMPLAYWPLDARDFVAPRLMRARIGGFDGLVALDEGQIGVPAQIGEGYQSTNPQRPVRQAIIVPSRADDPLDFTSTGTWSTWASFTTLPSVIGRPEMLIDKGGFATDCALEATSTQTAGDGFAFFFGGTQVSANIPLQVGVWYHVVATFDSLSQICLYVNGAQRGCVQGTDRPHDVQALKFGEGNYFTGIFLIGALDEIVMWNVALSPAQVQTLYDLGSQGLSIVAD